MKNLFIHFIFLLGSIHLAAQLNLCQTYDRFNIDQVENNIVLAQLASDLTVDCNVDWRFCQIAFDLLYEAEDILANIFNGHNNGGCLDCDPILLIDIGNDLYQEAKRLDSLGRTNRIGNIYGTLLQWQTNICSSVNTPKKIPPIKIAWSPVGLWTVNGNSQHIASIQPQTGFTSYVINLGSHKSVAKMVNGTEIFAQSWNATGVFLDQGNTIQWKDQTWTRVSNDPSSMYPCTKEEMSGEHNASLMGMIGSTRMYKHGDTFCNRKQGFYLKLVGQVVERYEKRNGRYIKVSVQKVSNVVPLDSGKTRYVLENNDWLTVY